MAAIPPPVFPPKHSLIRMGWALVSTLHPLTGSRASGSMTATASAGAAVTVPKGWYAVPLVDTGGNGMAYLDFHRMVKTSAETIVDPVADPSGTDIPFVSVIGGVRQNLDAGTVFRWYPEAPAGLDDTAIASAASTGATSPTGIGTIRQAITWEGLGVASSAADIWKAGTDDFPAVIVAWNSAAEPQMYGPGRSFTRHTFDVFVVVTRLDGQHQRRDEGLALLDVVKRELGYRAQVDGELFSQPPTIPGRLSRLAVDPGSHVYTFSLQVQETAVRTERRTAPALTKMRTRIQTPDDGTIQPPADPIDVVDATEDVP